MVFGAMNLSLYFNRGSNDHPQQQALLNLTEITLSFTRKFRSLYIRYPHKEITEAYTIT